jgi:hypothetical protein
MDLSPETLAAQALGEADPWSGHRRPARGRLGHPGQTRLLWAETPANPMWEISRARLAA